MGLSEFPDQLPSVILHFDGNIGNGSLCVQEPLIRHRCQRFRLLCSLKIADIGILVKALS
jgi:hypothetical protein